MFRFFLFLLILALILAFLIVFANWFFKIDFLKLFSRVEKRKFDKEKQGYKEIHELYDEEKKKV